jgi:hypothetical protein
VPNDLPQHFMFMSQASGSQFVSKIFPLNLQTTNWNETDWIHFTIVRALGWWALPSGGAYQPITVPGALNNPGGGHEVTTVTPLIDDAKFGAHVGAITVYPDVLSPNLVAGLATANPFGVPEPTAIAVLSIVMALLAIVRFPRRY